MHTWVFVLAVRSIFTPLSASSLQCTCLAWLRQAGSETASSAKPSKETMRATAPPLMPREAIFSGSCASRPVLSWPRGYRIEKEVPWVNSKRLIECLLYFRLTALCRPGMPVTSNKNWLSRTSSCLSLVACCCRFLVRALSFTLER